MTLLHDLYKNMESTLERMEIPPRPGILDQIMLEAKQEEPDFLRLATLISEDMSLSAGLIKTVNSPFFGLQRKATSVQEAMLLLGLELASRMVAGILLRHVFPRRADLEQVWDAALKTAMLTHWLVSRMDKSLRIRPADAYTFALFRDCGMAVLLLKKHDYAKTLELASEDAKHSFTDEEQGQLAINHAIVGSRLAHEWNLPDSMALGILFHHALCAKLPDVEKLGQDSRRMIALAHLAEKFLEDNGVIATNEEWNKRGAVCLNILELDAGAVEELGNESALFIREQLPNLII